MSRLFQASEVSNSRNDCDFAGDTHLGGGGDGLGR